MKDPTRNRTQPCEHTDTPATALTSEKPYARSKQSAAPFFLFGTNEKITTAQKSLYGPEEITTA